MRVTKAVCSALLMACLLTGSAVAEKKIVMTFAGDCTIGCEERLMGAVYSFPGVLKKQGYAYFLEKMKPLFSEDDLTVVNFEGVLKADDKRKENKTYCFRGLPDYAKILTLGSVEAVNLANNHAGDYGDEGRASTLEALAKEGIGTFGADFSYVYEKDGVKIAFCGFTRTAYFAQKDSYTQFIKSLKDAGANAVVCFLHFGQEYSGHHSNDQARMARTMVDAGADLIIGSHPHVAHGMEIYEGVNILYSVGNFVFGGNALVRANECIVPRITMTFDDQGHYLGQQMRIYPANISGDSKKNDYQPRLVEGDAAEEVYALFDRDSVGQPEPVLQTNEYRDYAFVSAVPREPAATPEASATPTPVQGATATLTGDAATNAVSAGYTLQPSLTPKAGASASPAPLAQAAPTSQPEAKK
ncbi:MAG TPA: CapA family protein [Candidatus Limiplasma sp.]|nr:CapA family protein [Candidatus Limiplasma sp.]HPS81530.1 CapA family protein [Candidatus Limiplasma sp.]